MIIAKLVGIKFPTPRNVREGTFPEHSPVVEISDKNEIKTKISEYLFDSEPKYDSILGMYEGQLYVFEPDSREYKTYTRKIVGYHPLQELVKIN